jgi:hypothetical protein
MTTVNLDNSLNSPELNPPGYSVWVGGQTQGDTANGAIEVDHIDRAVVKFTITPQLLSNGNLLTWYSEDGTNWTAGTTIEGPFFDGQIILIPTENTRQE